MSINLSALMKQRYDTAANWTAQNPTLLAGEIGIESDTKKWKVGTGSTAWTSLTYAIGGTYPIVNADIAAAAGIAYSKLATLTSGNIVLGSAANVATSTAVTGDVTISNTGVTAIASGVIVNADINASAGIVDTKLATIATAGKVSNSATTAASANTASAIVARDASGNFTAGTITAALTGAASSNVLKAGDTMTGVLAVTAGTAALPGIAVSGDTNTGIYSPGADQLAISTGGTGRLFVNASGLTGLGVSSITAGLTVATYGSQPETNANTYSYPVGRHSVNLGTVPNATNLWAGFVGTYANSSGSCNFLLQPGYNDLGQQAGAYIGGELTGVASTAITFGHLTGAATLAGNSTKSEKVRIDPSGRLLVGTSSGNANGGILQLTSGITFPATAVAASDVNTLDDYEEGTFTATVQGSTTSGTATYATQTAQYTKIGNRVLFNLRIIYTGGTGTGNLRVGGLPFTSSSAMAGAVTNVIAENITGTALYVFVGSVGVNTTYVGIDQLPTGGGAAIATAYDAAGDISIAGQYFV
jgi:hypothetical protein